MNAPAPQQPSAPVIKKVKHPHHAWLAPFAGFGATLLLSCLMGNVAKGAESPILAGVIGLFVIAVFFSFIIFGVIKSVQCFIGMRHPIHGTFGLLFNVGTIILMALMFIGAMNAAAAVKAGMEAEQNNSSTQP